MPRIQTLRRKFGIAPLLSVTTAARDGCRASAIIVTDRPDRTLIALCKRLAHGSKVEFTRDHVVVTLPDGIAGRAILDSSAGALIIRIEADDWQRLRAIKRCLGTDLARIAGDPSTIVWFGAGGDRH